MSVQFSFFGSNVFFFPLQVKKKKMSKERRKVERRKSKRKWNNPIDKPKETPTALVPINIVPRVIQGSPSSCSVVVVLLKVKGLEFLSNGFVYYSVIIMMLCYFLGNSCRNHTFFSLGFNCYSTVMAIVMVLCQFSNVMVVSIMHF